ncbi:MAG: DNA polymerase III subunit alpha [Candidatus Westeberhardia cardiocondylae]|nr:DNA polymerase III subunit alpha [Candidatus Westeberhardia cardiocondylae]
MITPKFIHLRMHSDYSIKDGLIKLNSLIKKTKELKMPAIALTDNMNLFGLIKFYNISFKKGIKPIIGSDITLKTNEIIPEFTKMTALAANNIGYKNLIQLLTISYKHGYNPTIGPFIDIKHLTKYNEGIILLSGGIKGDIGNCIIKNNLSKIEKYIIFYKKYFFNRYYLELTRTGRPYEEYYIKSAIQLAIFNELPVVATNDVLFLTKEDFYAHEIRVAIHEGYKINNKTNKQKLYSPQQYMRNEQEMCELFSDIPEALTNSVKIAERCNVTIHFDKYTFPKFPKKNLSNKNYLIKLAKDGLKTKLNFLYPNKNTRKKKFPIYEKRLKNELQTIGNMNLSSYFLIVMEFIQWAKNNNIPVGPGRGSGAGSLVAYVLKITELDPLLFNLLFERFLNPERTSQPDLDIDFCMKKRDLVIKHVIDSYGKDSVSQIITFGTMTAKAVIRDVGRALGYPYNFVDHIAKLIPFDPKITIKKSFIINPILKKKYETDQEIQTLINMAIKLEGTIRNVGKHAGGIVITPKNITNFSPLYCDFSGENIVTQFDKYDIEKLGLIKFDFLGLRTLTIIDKTLKMINKHRKEKKLHLIKINEIPTNDKESFKKLQKSETTAIFQLESNGIKNLIKRLKPDCFEDIIALIALFRPGPIKSGMINNFINRKNGHETISYLDPKLTKNKLLQKILKPTYGIILYQEQVMQIAQTLAGYTLKNADILRCAMTKKEPKEMIKQQLLFNKGTKKNKIDYELSKKIFNILEKFSGYSFNKSHAAAYALLTYQTLWLKTHYPAEFMAATMNADIDNTEKITNWINECARMKIKVLKPDINNSQYHFYVDKNENIVYGMGAIKGIGKKTVKTIINTRNKNGNFHNLFDFFLKHNTNIINKRTLEKLAMSGSLDVFGIHRAALIESIKKIINVNNQYEINKKFGQMDMFETASKTISRILQNNNEIITPWSKQITLDNEQKTLGIYLSGNPITQFLKEITFYNIQYTLIKYIKFKIDNINKIITTIGIVINIKLIHNKQSKNIGIITISDESKKLLNIILIDKILEKNQYMLKKNSILMIQGKIVFNNFSKKYTIIATTIMNIIKIREKYIQKIAILLTEKQINHKFLNNLEKVLKNYQPGKIPIYLFHKKENKQKSYLNICSKITPSDSLFNKLNMLVGKNKIKLKFQRIVKDIL